MLIPSRDILCVEIKFNEGVLDCQVSLINDKCGPTRTKKEVRWAKTSTNESEESSRQVLSSFIADISIQTSSYFGLLSTYRNIVSRTFISFIASKNPVECLSLNEGNFLKNVFSEYLSQTLS